MTYRTVNETLKKQYHTLRQLIVNENKLTNGQKETYILLDRYFQLANKYGSECVEKETIEHITKKIKSNHLGEERGLEAKMRKSRNIITPSKKEVAKMFREKRL